MKIPCVERLPFIVTGLSFLQAELSPVQFNNLTMTATAVILGSKFNLTEISGMWLSEKCVSTISYFLSDAKFSTWEMQRLYLIRALSLYNINGGYFIIDDTMKHHTKFCRWIHGVCILFDHALKTNLKAVCIVALYYSDGGRIKFPITFRIYYQDKSEGKKILPWNRHRQFICKKKYDLAIEMIEWAMDNGFPGCTVLADSWFGISPFIKELKRLKLTYVLEIRSNLNVKKRCIPPRLGKNGKLLKNQYDTENIADYFRVIPVSRKYGFARDRENGKDEKILYHVKTVTVRINSLPGKHRVIESADPLRKTVKYLITNELTWEASKILTTYSCRWVIEEFFRNAKQLSDMEGITVRSERGITVSLCLIFWIDFLLHYENYKQSTAGEKQKDSLTIPSIIRRSAYENLLAFVTKIENDENFLVRWCSIEKTRIERKRKAHSQLVEITSDDDKMKKAA